MFRVCFCIFVLITLLAGCSQAGEPITPESGSDDLYLSPIADITPASGDIIPTIGLMGAWEFHINLDDMSADLIAKRSSAIGEAWIISGISYFTMSPCATCLKMTGLELLPDGIVSAKFHIRHPFEPGDKLKPPSATNRLDLDVFDVALIVYPQNFSPETFYLTGRSIYSGICDSPDGYTTELSNLIGDQAALPYYLVIDDSITGSSTFNILEMGASADFDARFDLSAGTVMFDLYLTMGYGASAIRPERLIPKYYNPEFNRNAAWKVVVFPPEPAEEGYTWDDDDPNTTYDVVVHVYDWQQGATVYDNPEDFHNAPDDNIYASSNVASVSVEIPGMTNTLPIETNAISGSGSPDDPLVYVFPIGNENLISAGEYKGLVRVVDERLPVSNYLTENRDYLINTPDGVTLHEYLLTEYATYQTFTATVVESAITEPTGNLVWAKHAGGMLRDDGSAITSLSDNTIVVTGYFRHEATFGEDEPNETVLVAPASNEADAFVAWYNPDGTLSLVKGAGGRGNDQGYGVASLSDDSVIVVGSFVDSITFEQGEPNSTTLESQGGMDIFLARYNGDRTFAWAKRAGGSLSCEGEGVTVLSDNSFVITGNFQGTAIFGAGEPNEETLIAVGQRDIFVARYDSSGSLIWAKRAGGISSWDYGKSVATLSDDSVAVSGHFGDQAVFGQGEPNETTLVCEGGYDIFIARYGSNGALQWAKHAGGERSALSLGVTSLYDDSIAITGGFTEEATFGHGELNETTLYTPGSQNMYIARYNADGSLLWAKSAGGDSGSAGYDVASLPDNSTVIVGYFTNPTVFGQGEPNETELTTPGDNSIFIARYDQTGSLLWARKATSPSRNIGKGITALSDNSTVITGYKSMTCIFGEGEPNETHLTGVNDSPYIFVARYYP